MELRVQSAKNFLTLVRTKFQGQAHVYEEFLRVMKSFKEQQIDTQVVCEKAQQLFAGHPKLLQEFNKLIPDQYKIEISHQSQYPEATDFMKSVKEETKSQPDIYGKFVNILKYYKDKKTSLESTNNYVNQLFGNYPHLQERFKAFLPNPEEEQKPVKMPKPALEKILIPELGDPLSKNEWHFIRRLKKVLELNSDESHDFFNELSLALELFAECVISKKEFFEMIRPLFSSVDPLKFVRNRMYGTPDDLQELINSKLHLMFEMLVSILSCREVARRKQVLFYRRLFDDKPRTIGYSYMQLDNPQIKMPTQIFNREFISIAHGSEDVNFSHFRKNNFEDVLFKCEDQMYELDMTIESTKYLLKKLEQAYEKLKSLPVEEQSEFKLDPKLISPFRIKVIERIYTNYSQKIVNMLHNCSQRALQVVIARLSQKIKSWEQLKSMEKSKIWFDMLEKNFLKSLDHRFFYFKQNEKKLINTKNFLSQLKQRWSLTTQYKQKISAYLDGRVKDGYEFMGGSQRKLFFSSMSGLTSEEIPHKVPKNYSDPMIQQIRNGMNFKNLPQFRLLFSCRAVLLDAVRVLLFALGDKLKTKLSVITLFEQFMEIQWPADILNNKIQEYFDGNQETEEIADYEITKRQIAPGKGLRTRKDKIFDLFVPSKKSFSVLYTTIGIYYFFRFFYALYERLLKARAIFSGQVCQRSLDYGEYLFTGESQYKAFLQFLLKTLSSQSEFLKSEEHYRQIFSGDAFIFFNLSKLVTNTAKSANSLDDSFKKSLDLAAQGLTEEMHYIRALQIPGPLVRLHWDYRILTINFIENPNLGDENIQEYKNKLLVSSVSSPLQADLSIFYARLDRNYKNRGVSLSELEDSIYQKNCLESGLREGSLKLQFRSGGEDFFYKFNKSL